MRAWIAGVVLVWATGVAGAVEPDPMAREILAELIGIDTTQTSGNTTIAAEAMAARLRAGGFGADELEVIGPTPTRGNLLVHFKGDGSKRPLLLLAHIDVVDAAAAEWELPPFELRESDGYFYGRGTADNKSSAAILVSNLIQLRAAGLVPKRDIYVALTADEEGGEHNGVQWLLANRPQLRNVELALNEGGKGTSIDGHPSANRLQFSEKVYFSYKVEASGAGGHSARPGKDNPIYRVAAGLSRIEAFAFPVNLSDGTREYFRQQAKLEQGALAADMLAITELPIDPAAAAQLADVPEFNSTMRTTCVATQISGGHAENALPMRASAVINCRVLPHESIDSVTTTLAGVLADDQLTITPLREATPSPPSPLDEIILGPVREISEAMWPGVLVIPVMGVGATDSLHTRNAGIPTYGITGQFHDQGENRAHGKDERIGVQAFYEAREFMGRLLRALAF